MSYLLDLQAQETPDSDARGVPVNPVSTISVGFICVLSTISLSFC